jgi:hypothetical protein
MSRRIPEPQLCHGPQCYNRVADGRSFCSDRCRWRRRNLNITFHRAFARDRFCEGCGGLLVIGLDDRREDARFCKNACRQRAYRARKGTRIRVKKRHLPERLSPSSGHLSPLPER